MHPEACIMSTRTIRSDATFSPATYRRSLAELFSALGQREQLELAERVAILPRHIHKLASDGLIAADFRKSR